jgi:chloride channel protein, CIC family
MSVETEVHAEPVEKQSGLFKLVLLSLLAGAVAGFLGAVFRLSIEQADRWRDQLIGWAYGETLMGGVLVVAICAATTGIAAWLVRRFSPQAEGSGIPHVEAVARGELPAAPYRLVPIKFFGGLLAIGSGLALGREGPSVQIGAGTAHYLGKLFSCNEDDRKTLLAAGAGAGLATAFNAPIAGAAFVLEELVRRFDTRITIATLGASAGAIAVARMLLGNEPDFHLEPLPYLGLGMVIVHLALGVVAGLLGVLYNRSLLATLAAMEQLRGWPVELRAALVGAAVGLTAWFAPSWVGGGDAITQRTLAGAETVAVLPIIFLFRFGLGAVSYAARTPGGLFAPMLVLGAQSGLLFGIFCNQWFPTVFPNPTVFAVVGMAAFFSAVVRSPLTGMILVTEMTANVTLLLPMLASCCAAMAVPTLLGNAPIYDSLRERALEKSRK